MFGCGRNGREGDLRETIVDYAGRSSRLGRLGVYVGKRESLPEITLAIPPVLKDLK
jgi:hypothetical protein